jgi:hypothetical protein
MIRGITLKFSRTEGVGWNALLDEAATRQEADASGTIQNMTSSLTARVCSIGNYEAILIWKQAPKQFSRPIISGTFSI